MFWQSGCFFFFSKKGSSDCCGIKLQYTKEITYSHPIIKLQQSHVPCVRSCWPDGRLFVFLEVLFLFRLKKVLIDDVMTLSLRTPFFYSLYDTVFSYDTQQVVKVSSLTHCFNLATSFAYGDDAGFLICCPSPISGAVIQSNSWPLSVLRHLCNMKFWHAE